MIFVVAHSPLHISDLALLPSFQAEKLTHAFFSVLCPTADSVFADNPEIFDEIIFKASTNPRYLTRHFFRQHSPSLQMPIFPSPEQVPYSSVIAEVFNAINFRTQNRINAVPTAEVLNATILAKLHSALFLFPVVQVPFDRIAPLPSPDSSLPLVNLLPYCCVLLPEPANGDFFCINRGYFQWFRKKNLRLSAKQPLFLSKRISSLVQNNLRRNAKQPPFLLNK